MDQSEPRNGAQKQNKLGLELVFTKQIKQIVKMLSI